MERTIVGHVSPDWDCIMALWLLQRFGPFADAEVKLVNTGQPDPEALAQAAAVVDTGRVYDPACWRFDHHQLSDPNRTCAAMQVYEWLAAAQAIDYLLPLVSLVYAGDTGKDDAASSRLVGIHAQLAAWKLRYQSDAMLLLSGYEVLDHLNAHLLNAHQARRMLEQYTVYRSRDGLLIALDAAPPHTTGAAFEAGAQLVVWHSPLPQIPSVAVGISRAFGATVHAGDLVGRAAQWTQDGAVFEELETWYRHAAGFFAGRGTDKAPDNRPLACSIVHIAAALDFAWEREEVSADRSG